MGLDAALIELMHDEIKLEAPSGRDKFNNQTYAAPITVKCYIQRTNVEARSETGEELTSTVQAILAQPELPVTVDWKLTLPDEPPHNGDTPAIMQILSAKDERGDPYYLEIRA